MTTALQRKPSLPLSPLTEISRAETLRSLVTGLRTDLPRVDPVADTDPNGQALQDPFLTFHLERPRAKVQLASRRPSIYQSFEEVIQLIAAKAETIPDNDEINRHYLDALYQYAYLYDSAREKLEELAQKSDRAANYVKKLSATSSTPSKAL